MSRNFYILAGALLLFSLICLGMSLGTSGSLLWAHGTPEQGLPGDAPAWRILAFFFFFGSALVCMVGTITHMFEQASRRHEEHQRKENKHSHPPER